MKQICIVIKNEFIKLLSEKKFYILLILISILVLMGTIAYKDMINNIVQENIKSTAYSQEFRDSLLNFNGISFSKLFLTDFIYKPYFSIYLIFIAIIAIDIFSNDYSTGNMKFMLLTNITRKELYIGKILFMFLVALVIVLMNLLISLTIGSIVFGSNFDIKSIGELIIIYGAAVLPAVAFSLIIAIISLFRLESTIITIASIGAVIIIGVIDTLTEFRSISPIGILSLFNDKFPEINFALLIGIVVSAIYSIVLSIILLKYSKKVDILA